VDVLGKKVKLQVIIASSVRNILESLFAATLDLGYCWARKISVSLQIQNNHKTINALFVELSREVTIGKKFCSQE
jgi:hypothetical protein